MTLYSLLADFVLILHVLFVLFVVLGLPGIFLGAACGWRWVRSFRLRGLHLAGVCLVALQAWAGLICPLTTIEMWLRRHGDLTAYEGSFIAHYLQRFLYWELPPWVFIAAYSLFALLVVIAWYRVPPTRAGESFDARR